MKNDCKWSWQFCTYQQKQKSKRQTFRVLYSLSWSLFYSLCHTCPLCFVGYNGSNFPLKFGLLVNSHKFTSTTVSVGMSGHSLLCSSTDEIICAFLPFLLLLLLPFVSVEHFMYFRLVHHACGTFWQQFFIQVYDSENELAIIAEEYSNIELSTHAYSI